MLIIGMLAVLTAPAPWVFAAEQPAQGLSEEMLLLKEETVTTPTTSEQPISESPSNIYVITDEDIRHSGAIDIPTLLRRVPGMEVMQTSGGDYDVSVRGDNQLQANKLLVMVDGRSIYIDAQGLVFWKLLPVTLPEIKRIEVIKGPASALYGFNAFDGVVNIITKSPEEMKGTTLQFGGGEFGTISSAAIQAGTVGKFGYRLSVGHDQTNQWRSRDSLAFRDNKFNVQTEYALSSLSKLSVSGGLVDANRLDSTMVTISLPQNTPQQGYADVLYTRPNFFVRGWWQGFADTTNVLTQPPLAPFLRITDRSFSSISKTRSSSFNGEAQHAVDFGATNRLTYGVNYRTTIMSFNFNADWSRDERLGFYIQDEWRTTQTLTMVAGVRYDLDAGINPTVSPRLALLYKPVPDHTFRTSVSVGYRPPTLPEQNLDIRGVVIPLLPFCAFLPPNTCIQPTNGSSNLVPEEIVSYEAGYQGWYFKHRVRARVDLFFNHISNLISFAQVSPTTTTAVNAPDLDIYGGEAGLEFLATQWLTGFANYSYEEIGQSSTSTSLRGAPRFKFNVGLRGEWENGLSADAALYHVGAATYPVSSAFAAFGVPLNGRVGSYNLLNLRGAYKFWQQQATAGYMREAEVAVSAFNALNDRHKETPVGDTIGSLVMGWLTLRY